MTKLREIKTGPSVGVVYLAFGIRFEDASTNSIATKETSPKKVARALEKEFGYDKGYFDEIFLIENGPEGPNVVQHWNADKDF